MNEQPQLKGIKVLAALNGLELFGHERGNIEVFKVLRQLGAEVRIAVNERDNGGEVAAELSDLGFDIFPISFGPQWSLQWIKNEGPGFAFRQFKRLFASSWRFHKEVLSYRPTHIHLGSPLAYSFISLALLRHRKLPLVWRMGDCPSADSRFNFPIWKAAMRRADHIVTISNFVKQAAIQYRVPAEKITLIYNLAPESRSDALESPGIKGSEQALIYVGAIAEHKGLLQLVDAFALAHQDFPNLKLWVLGGSRWDTAFRKILERRIDEHKIESRVLFAGHVGNPQPWYSAASLHIAPSICDEALGNVVMEAKRSGTPSIVFPSGGLPEMIRHKTDGYVCEEKTAESLAHAIKWVLNDPHRLAQLKQQAKLDYLTRFGPERFAYEWAQVYSNLTSTTRRKK